MTILDSAVFSFVFVCLFFCFHWFLWNVKFISKAAVDVLAEDVTSVTSRIQQLFFLYMQVLGLNNRFPLCGNLSLCESRRCSGRENVTRVAIDTLRLKKLQSWKVYQICRFGVWIGIQTLIWTFACRCCSHRAEVGWSETPWWLRNSWP